MKLIAISKWARESKIRQFEAALIAKNLTTNFNAFFKEGQVIFDLLGCHLTSAEPCSGLYPALRSGLSWSMHSKLYFSFDLNYTEDL